MNYKQLIHKEMVKTSLTLDFYFKKKPKKCTLVNHKNNLKILFFITLTIK